MGRNFNKKYMFDSDREGMKKKGERIIKYMFDSNIVEVFRDGSVLIKNGHDNFVAFSPKGAQQLQEILRLIKKYDLERTFKNEV